MMVISCKPPGMYTVVRPFWACAKVSREVMFSARTQLAAWKSFLAVESDESLKDLIERTVGELIYCQEIRGLSAYPSYCISYSYRVGDC